MNETVRTLTRDQAQTIYKKYLTEDFPPDERKPWVMIRRRMEQNAYRCLGLFEGDELRSYAFFALNGPDALLDYFAVLKPYRGQGFGSRFLQLLRKENDGEDWVIVEAEDPAAAADEKERTVRERRVRFYLQNGLTDTGARARVFGVDYVLLAFPRQNVSNADQVYGALYRSFLPAGAYQKWISILPGKEEPHA